MHVLHRRLYVHLQDESSILFLDTVQISKTGHSVYPGRYVFAGAGYTAGQEKYWQRAVMSMDSKDSMKLARLTSLKRVGTLDDNKKNRDRMNDSLESYFRKRSERRNKRSDG